jgi:hypothetical protein
LLQGIDPDYITAGHKHAGHVVGGRAATTLSVPGMKQGQLAAAQAWLIIT